MFKWNSIDLKIYYTLIAARVVFGLILALANDTFISAIVVIACLMGLIVCFGVRRPYADNKQTIRSIMNFVSSMAIIACYVILSIIGPTSG